MEKNKKEHKFVSECIKPVTATSDVLAMATGAPGLPSAFVWRDKTLKVAKILHVWRETGPCKHGSSELYVRKHWFEVEITDDQTAKIYFERQHRGGKRTDRWWLFSIQGSKG